MNRLVIGLLLCGCTATAQELYPVMLKNELWHGEQRLLRYHPEGEDFVITNGKRRFNRALYGTHTAFRVEAGDLPEFAIYMPGMGGNLKLGFTIGNRSIWLINAHQVIAKYTPGKMSYEIRDPILGNGVFHIVILALSDAEGFIVQTQLEGAENPPELVYAFGGASGKKFTRSGDMGPDPESSFYLHPEDCTTNTYQIKEDAFHLKYGKGQSAELTGVFPTPLKLADAAQMTSPGQFYQSKVSNAPALTGKKQLVNGEKLFVVIKNPAASHDNLTYPALASMYVAAEESRLKIAGQIKLDTPDPYINTIGGALSIASDAIWESPSYMHGAVGWRMRLNGWRGPYTADPLGWHDRAKTHFESYAKSQVQSPSSGPVIADTAFHLARQQEKMGASMFTAGYISRDPEGKSIRPHHYDMNLVYIDELLWHFNWTGDLSFVKKMWPVLKLHLDWEKRNFDPDNDGLYDAYAAIWASDALYYSGGAVTHTSAYNYRANVMAAQLAKLIGEPYIPYEKEAAKILQAMNNTLWMPDQGVYAEYKDALGLKKLHPAAALWTVYHSIDSSVPDAFQAYQSLRYIDAEIPHIPVKGTGLPDGQYYTLSTSNWMPYNWSINNVVMAESMHTALANWQAGRNEEGFKLFKSEILADMYMGGSPANFVQISHYDAARGEAYRDFADPIGISSRALVEGLFGILPDVLHQMLTIRPGFPSSWDHASIATPDLDFKFTRNGKADHYILKPSFTIPLALKLQVKANGAAVSSIRVNGQAISWKNSNDAIGTPMIEINVPPAVLDDIEIIWKGDNFKKPVLAPVYAMGDLFRLNLDPRITITGFKDPQHVFTGLTLKGSGFNGRLSGAPGNRTAFLQLKMNGFTWWYPLCFELTAPVSISSAKIQEKNKLLFTVTNNSNLPVKGVLKVNGFKRRIVLKAKENTGMISLGNPFIHPGTNVAVFIGDEEKSTGRRTYTEGKVTNWDIEQQKVIQQRRVDLSSYFNGQVTQIFSNKYLTPRPQTTTLQLPWQGIGDWPNALGTANIDDSGWRKLAGKENQVILPQGIKLSTPGTADQQNIMFSSQWDNYPAEKEVPLTGKAGHAYFLMAGSTNPMQSQFDNGKIVINYTDGTSSELILRNPETWWPIQEDYYTDGFAFDLKNARPPRIHLKTGKIVYGRQPELNTNQQIIDGGAATVLDLPLDNTKNLKSLQLITLANDVVIGLMSVTLTEY